MTSPVTKVTLTFPPPHIFASEELAFIIPTFAILEVICQLPLLQNEDDLCIP